MSDTETSRRRPWLAAALALVVSGLGHAYLRRWARAFGWYAAITATLVFVVPDAAIEQLIARGRPPIVEIVPVLVVVAASVVDAYVLAVRNNRAHERRLATTNATEAASPDHDTTTRDAAETAEATTAETAEATTAETAEATTAETSGTGATTAAPESPESAAGSDTDTISCPHCGREADATLDFCQWCAEPLDE